MKRVCFLLFILLGLRGSCDAQWKKVSQFSVAARSMYFLDQIGHPEIGFVGLDNGELQRTSDSGKTWQIIMTEPDGLSISDITFKDASTGWFVSEPFAGQTGPSKVFTTIDGGTTWKLQYEDAGGSFTSIYYHQARNILFLSEWQRGGLSSTDGGVTWNTFTDRSPINGYAFTDRNNGIVTFAGATPSSCIQTLDGGNNWQALVISPSACWQPAAIAGTTTFFMFSEYTTTLTRSDDNGVTWIPIKTLILMPGGRSTLGSSGCLRITPCNQMYIQTTGEGFYSSSDLGVSWNSIGGPSNEVDTRFWVDENDVFASDYQGALWSFHGSSARSAVSIPQDFVNLLSNDCQTFDTTILYRSINCIGGIDSIQIASIKGNPNFSIGAGEIIPRGFVSTDSIRILYHPNSVGLDTALLLIKFNVNGTEIDTVIRLFGSSIKPVTAFTTQLQGQDTTFTFSVSKDIPASSGLDSMTFDLHFNSDMVKLNTEVSPAGWKITAREIQPGWWNCWFYNYSHTDIAANQILATFHFSSYLTLDTVSSVVLKAGDVFFDLLKHTGCTIAALPQDDSAIIHAEDICGNKTLRHFLTTGNIDTKIISIRPNPATNEISIETETPSKREVNFIIYDDLGRECLNQKQSLQGKMTLTFPIASLSAGQYHLMLKSSEGSVASDFIKIK